MEKNLGLKLVRWCKDLPVNFEHDLSGMCDGVGYSSQDKVIYNGTLDTVFINVRKRQPNCSSLLSDAIVKSYISKLEDYQLLNSSDIWPLSDHEVEGILVQEDVSSVVWSEVEKKLVFDDLPSLKTTTILRSPLVVDWARSVSFLSDNIDMLKYFMCVVWHGRQLIKDNKRSFNSSITIEAIESSAFFHFLCHVKFKGKNQVQKWLESSISGGSFNRDNLISSIDKNYIQFQGQRNNLIDALNGVVGIAREALVALIFNNVENPFFYFPFWINTVFLTPAERKYFVPCRSDFLSDITCFLETVQDTRIKSVLYLFSVTGCASFRSVSDVPEDYFEKIIEAKVTSRDYNTSVGLPHTAMHRFFEFMHQDPDFMERSNFKAFPVGKISRKNTRRISNAIEGKKSINLEWAEGSIPANIVEQLKSWTHLSANSNKMTSVSHFIDFIENLNISSSNKIESLADIKPDHVYQPKLANQPVTTIVGYLKNLDVSSNKKASIQTCRLHYGTIRSILDHFISRHHLDTGIFLPNPMPQTSDVLGTRASKTKTDKIPMETAFHDIVLEVASENNYQFAKLQGISQTQLFNYSTNQYEVVDNYTIPRVLHLTLLVPIRLHQARWLDQGLLDDMLWDTSNEQYVSNTSRLANFQYPDGKRHCTRHGRTAVLKNTELKGNSSLSLYINTNKTKTYTLQKKGHTGYTIPWPYASGIRALQDVYDIIEEQIRFNEIYSPPDVVTPVKVMDENSSKYNIRIWHQLPFFTPLFRDVGQQNAKASAMMAIDKEAFGDRVSLFLPVSDSKLRDYYFDVIEEADRRYKTRYPQFRNHLVAFDENGDLRHSLHGLRVTGITALLEAGLDVEIVKVIAGHATEVMTIYYRKIFHDDFIKKLMEATKKQALKTKNAAQHLEGNKNLISIIDVSNSYSNFREDPKIEDLSGESSKGVPLFIKGGVCFSFDCKTGGIKIESSRNGREKVVISDVFGGYQRCGNCRFWRSSPNFLLEQIYYFNDVSRELSNLYTKQQSLIKKQHEVFDDQSLEFPEQEAREIGCQIDNLTNIIAHRAIELKNRKAMLEASLSELETSDIDKSLALTIPGMPADNTPEMKALTDFESCLELTAQAAMLGISTDTETLEMKSLDKFLSQLVSLGDQKNPLLFAPDSATKRAAILIKLNQAIQMIGRTFTDEEFQDPMILFDTLNLETINDLSKALVDFSDNKKLLEEFKK